MPPAHEPPTVKSCNLCRPSTSNWSSTTLPGVHCSNNLTRREVHTRQLEDTELGTVAHQVHNGRDRRPPVLRRRPIGSSVCSCGHTSESARSSEPAVYMTCTCPQLAQTIRKFEGGSEDVGEVQRGRNPLPTSAESQLELSEAEDEPPGYDGEVVHTTRRWSRLTLCALPKNPICESRLGTCGA